MMQLLLLIVLEISNLLLSVPVSLAFQFTPGKRFENHVLRQKHGISLEKCFEICESMPACLSINYQRKYHVCEMNSDDANESTLVERPGFVYSQKTDFKKEINPKCDCTGNDACNDDGTCSATGCYGTIDNALVTGNMNSVGSKLKYNCKYKQTCGYHYKPNKFYARCNKDGVWKETYEDVCTTLFIGVAGLGGNLRDVWWRKNNYSDSNPLCVASNISACSKHFRHPFLNNWTCLNIKLLRFSVYHNGNETQFVIFNGSNAKMGNWFNQRKIISSSWSDLMTMSDNVNLGFRAIGSFYRRPFYMGYPGWTQCMKKQGWFFSSSPVNYSDMCTYEYVDGMESPFLIYSKGPTIATFSDPSQIECADFIRISIDCSRGC